MATIKSVDPERQKRVDQMMEANRRRSEILRNNPLQLLDKLAPASSKNYKNYYEINPPKGGWKETWILENTKDKVVYTNYSSIPQDIKKKIGIASTRRTDAKTIKIQVAEYNHLVAELEKSINKEKGIPQVIVDNWRFIDSFV